MSTKAKKAPKTGATKKVRPGTGEIKSAWLSFGDAAAYVGVNERIMRDYRVMGIFTVAPSGTRSLYFYRDELDAFIAGGQVAVEALRRTKGRS